MEELNAVLPILKDAEKALDTLNSSDISVIKGMKSVGPSLEGTIRMIYMLLNKQSNYSKITWA